jgi:hypothetical protein
VPLPDPAKACNLPPKLDAEALTLAALESSSVKLHACAEHQAQKSTLGLGMDVAFDDQAR